MSDEPPTITEVAGLLVIEWNGAGESVDITREALESLVEMVNDARTTLQAVVERGES